MTTMDLNAVRFPEQERKREYARKYYQANRTRARAYYALNKEKIKARAAAWRKANRERYLAQQSDYDLNRRKKDPPGEAGRTHGR